MNNIIRIGERDGPYAAFANNAPFALHLEGFTWPTAEHYIQARKFDYAAEAELIREAASAEEAIGIAHAMRVRMRVDWESILPEALHMAVWAKCYQHLELEEQLIQTGDAYLMAVLGSDTYFGVGSGLGANLLGKTLMKVREDLRTRREVFYGLVY